jgi:hypothetical protein
MSFTANKLDLKNWFDQGKNIGAVYMIVVYDSFSHEDYPAYVMPDDNVHERVMYYRRSSMQQVMEVYNLDLPWNEQTINAGGRVFSLPPWPENEIAK